MANFFQEFFGQKPKIPTLPPLDLGTEAGKAISANQKNLPAAEQLVSSTNKFSIDQITKMLESVIPGYDKMVSTATGNIQDELSGKIPTDVAGQIQDSAAARALGGGFAGSGAHGDLVARDLGLTSLALTERGLTSMENWLKTSASLYEPSMINVSSMFVTPGQEASFDVEERNAQFQRDWMKNQIAAMPAPWSADIHQTVAEILSVYSGGQTQGNPYMAKGGAGGGFGGGGGGFGGYGYSSGAGEGGSGFDPAFQTNFMDDSGGGGGGMDMAALGGLV